MMKTLAAILVVLSAAVSAADTNELTIVGGTIGTFYSLPGWMPRSVSAEDTPGNEGSYVRRTSIRIPKDCVITRDGVVTNVPMPTVAYDAEQDAYSWDFSQSVVPGDVLYEDLSSISTFDINDISWEAGGPGGIYDDHHYYYAYATNWTTLVLSNAIYSVKAVRSSAAMQASVVATCEANRERMYYASIGDRHETISQVTNVFTTRRTFGRSHLITVKNEIFKRSDACDADEQLLPITDGILLYPVYIYQPGVHKVLHWWSSSLFDLDDSHKFVPTFDWSEIQDVVNQFTNCAVSFRNYGWSTAGESELEPMKYLLSVGGLDGEYRSVDLPGYATDDYLPYVMTNWYPMCLQSRGVRHMNDDVIETWGGAGIRKLPMVLCGMNQLLAMQDRTIHIPETEIYCETLVESVTRSRVWDAEGYVTVSWDEGEGSWSVDRPSVTWTSHPVTNVYERDWDFYTTRIVLKTSKTDSSCSATLGTAFRMSRLFWTTQESAHNIVENEMLWRDPDATNYIPFEISFEQSGNTLILRLTCGWTELTSVETIPPSYRVPISGSASYIAEYTCEHPTNVTFNLGATQPGADAMSRSKTRRLGVFSAVRSFEDPDGSGYPYQWSIKRKRCKSSETTYAELSSIISHLNYQANIGVIGELYALCPVANPLNFAENAPVPNSTSFIEIGEGTATIEAGRSGFFRVTNYGRDDETITVAVDYDEPGVGLPTFLTEATMEVTVSCDCTPLSPACPRYFYGEGKVTPITQVDWSWNNMHLERNNQ